MKKYIFYTSDGFTENSKFEQTENCQILGWQKGKDANEGFKNFKKENPDIDLEGICCQELKNDKVYYF